MKIFNRPGVGRAVLKTALSRVTCYMSCVMCHMSCVTGHMSTKKFEKVQKGFFGQSDGASGWRVCYQRGLPRVVFFILFWEYTLKKEKLNLLVFSNSLVNPGFK